MVFFLKKLRTKTIFFESFCDVYMDRFPKKKQPDSIVQKYQNVNEYLVRKYHIKVN